MNAPAEQRAASESARVSTLELFFDLVFVFTITQVALIVEHHPSWAAAGQAMLELAVIFWMYAGFAWLTNTVGATHPRQRAVLLLGMGAFLVVSLAVPRAFGDDGVAFGWAYLVLNAVHLAGFLIGGVPDAARSMRRIGSTNLVAAALIVVAGYCGAPWHWPLWIAAVAVQVGTAVLTRSNLHFAIAIDHFAERHGLMIIIVLGESIVSVALAATDQPVTPSLVFGVLCGLGASAAMWWCYFVDEDTAAAKAFARTDPATRAFVALVGYDLPHVFMLAGVVATAAGARLSLPTLTAPTSTAAAVLLAGGVATYLFALAVFRRVLAFGTPLSRLLGGVAVLGTIPLGTVAGAAQELLAAGAVVVVMLVVEHASLLRSRPGSGAPAPAGHPDPAG